MEEELRNLNTYSQVPLLKEIREEFYTNMLTMYKLKGYKFFETYFSSMLPRDQEIDLKDI